MVRTYRPAIEHVTAVRIGRRSATPTLGKNGGPDQYASTSMTRLVST